MDKYKLDEFFKLDDGEIERVLFKNQNVENLLLYQKSVEIIGIVEKSELSKSNVIKFNLVNRSATSYIIQVVIYDQKIREKIKPFIIDRNVLHLDGLFVNKKHQLYSSSNILYDLIVSTNTKFNLIKAAQQYENDVDSHTAVMTDIENCVKHDGLIQITCWMKQKIAASGPMNKGCLSDCVRYKLELRMATSCDMTQFQPGHHVKVTGIVKYTNMLPYILVQQKDDIVLASSEQKPARDYLKGAAIPKRPLDQNANVTQIPQKKMCLDQH